MKLIQSPAFVKAYKKLHVNQKVEVDNAIRTVRDNPSIGKGKSGDLAGMRVYKFQVQNQLTLLAYNVDTDSELLTLAAVGPHENFYRDLKH